jgi:hypothetical protein
MPKGCDRLALSRGVVAGCLVSRVRVVSTEQRTVSRHMCTPDLPRIVFPWYRVQSRLQQNVTASVDTCPLGVHNRLSVPDTPQTPRTRIIFQTV